MSLFFFIVSFLRPVFLLVIFTFHASFLLYATKNGVVVNNIISINILFELESSLIQLESSSIELVSALIELQNSLIE